MNEFKKVHIVQDESSHWYVIPDELRAEFEAAMDLGDCEEGWEAMDRFSEYMTGGDIANRHEFYIKEDG